MTLDHDEEKPAVGHFLRRRHSSIPVDPHSGVYTGLKEEEEVAEEEEEIPEEEDTHKNVNDCENEFKDKLDRDNCRSMMIQKNVIKEWF